MTKETNDQVVITDGGTMYDGPTAVALMRLRVMLSGLRFEVQTGGLKLCKGPSCWTIAKREFGFKGSREKVLAALEEKVAEEEAKVPHVDQRSAANDPPQG
jgi:hypothetical protein